MSRNTDFFKMLPWFGGLVTSIDPIILSPQHLVQADNIVFTTSGTRRKRPGQVFFRSSSLSAASDLVYGTDYWASVSNVKRTASVVARANSQSSVAASVYRSISWVAANYANFNTIALRVDHGGVTSTVFNNDLVMGFKNNGTTCLRVWNDQSTSSNLVLATAASGTLPGRGWIVQEARRRLYVAGDPNFPDLLYYSAAGDRTRWGGTGNGKGGTIVIGTENDRDPQGITAIMPGLNGEAVLYVAKRFSIYRIDQSDPNPDNWAVQLLSDGVGVVNPNAFASVDQDDICFISDRGIHLLSQLVDATTFREGSFLSAPIHNEFQETMDPTYRDRMQVVWYAPLNSILVTCKIDNRSSMDTIYLYNIEVNPEGKPYGWYRWLNTPCNYLIPRWNATSNFQELYGLGQRSGQSSDRGKITLLNQEDRWDFSSSTAIVTTLKSSIIYPEPMLDEKAFKGLGFIYRGRDNTTFQVQYAIDEITITPSLTFQQYLLGGFTLGSSVLGVGVLGTVPFGSKPNVQHTRGVGNNIQATITHSSVGDLEILGMIIETKPAGFSQNFARKI